MTDKDYERLRSTVQIKGEEGKSRYIGYIPENKKGKVIDESGVTIGVGFDIGQHNEWELNQIFPDNPELVKKLAHYVGLKGRAAQKKLKEIPLKLDKWADPETKTQTSKNYLDVIQKPMRWKIDKIVNKYEGIVGKGRFLKLDSALQETIFSTMYQMGIEGETGAPGFWKQATSGDWTGLYENLLDERPLEQGGWGRYADRRKRQAQKIWKSGTILRQSVIDEENRGKLFE